MGKKKGTLSCVQICIYIYIYIYLCVCVCVCVCVNVLVYCPLVLRILASPALATSHSLWSGNLMHSVLVCLPGELQFNISCCCYFYVIKLCVPPPPSIKWLLEE